MPKPIYELVIAGPGSGKTTGMVKKIAAVIPSIHPNRKLAAITFTNSSKDTIQNKLITQIELTNRVFIGTIHSFLIQHILIPYGRVFGDVPAHARYLEIDVFTKAKKLARDPADIQEVLGIKKRLLEQLNKKGIVPLSEVGSISRKIIYDNKIVRDAISHKLQYLFIDEFQDVDTIQYGVIDEIRKGKRTSIYAVGDPEQYITSFVYQSLNSRKPTKYKNWPINKYKAINKVDDQVSNINYRCSARIIDFVDRFHTEVNQECHNQGCKYSEVLFINHTDLPKIIKKYQRRIKSLERAKTMSRGSLSCFYLSYKNDTFSGFDGINRLVSNGTNKTSFFSEIEEFLLQCLVTNKSTLYNEKGITRHQFRKTVIETMSMLQSSDINISDLTKFLAKNFKTPVEIGKVNTAIGALKLNSLREQSGDNDWGSSHYYTSIHKAKGLEADAVLVVARTDNELRSWLNTDLSLRRQDKSDACRLGYVAFTRAKDYLYIACLKPVTDSTRQLLMDYLVKIQ